MNLIGLCGFGRVGKNTAAEHLPEWTVLGFADKLKEDLSSFIWDHYEIDVFDPTEEEKRIIRPLLIAHGEGMRALRKNHWIEELERTINICCANDENVAVVDIRNVNEVEYIKAHGGLVIYIHREGYGPASETEAWSISEILKRYQLPKVNNCSSKEELGRAVLRVWEMWQT